MKLEDMEVYAILDKLYGEYNLCKWSASINNKSGVIVDDDDITENDIDNITEFTTPIGKPNIFRDGNFNEQKIYYLVIKISKTNMSIYYSLFKNSDAIPDFHIINESKCFLGAVSKFEKVEKDENNNINITVINAQDFFKKIKDLYIEKFYKKQMKFQLIRHNVAPEETYIFMQLQNLIDNYLRSK